MSRIALTLFLAGATLWFAGGCKEHHHDKDRDQVREYVPKHALPPDLQPIVEGAKTLDYKATEDGRVFITDADDNNAVVASKRMRAGQVIDVSPDQNIITIDGRSVLNQDLNKAHSHRIYFEKE